MMRRLAPFAFVAAAVFSHVFAAPPSHGAEPRGGFAEIAGCISGADNLLISIVVDESQSLRETDPKALRVQGITSAIDSLEQLALLSPDLNVEVSLSTFARGYETLVDWQRLDTRSAAELRRTALRELPKRDAGNATDYRKALVGSKAELESRSRRLSDPDACKLVLWFTDGALDVDDATQTAANELCQTGGIADSVRHAGINVVALALFTPGAGVTFAQRDQLKAVAEGSGASTTCGTTPIPSDDATGVYLPADDPASLQLLFAGAGALVAGGTPGGTVTCPSTNCPNGNLELHIDSGLAGVRLVFQTDGQVKMRTPSGKTISASDGTVGTHDGASLTVLKRDSLTTINLNFSPFAKEPSVWTFTTREQTRLDAYWFWGARLIPLVTKFSAGSQNEITYQLSDQLGEPLPSTLYGLVRPSISVAGKTLKTTIDANGLIKAKYSLAAKDVPSNLEVVARADALSQPSRVRLGPIVSSDTFAVELPPAFPTIETESLDFGSLAGLGSRTAGITIRGSALGPTSVCFSSSLIALPGKEPTTSTVSAERECVEVAENGTETLDLTLSPESSAEGTASGTVTLTLTSADGENLDLTLPASVDMERTVDQRKRGELIAALLLLGLLIPALLLVGSNYFLLGRFAISSGTRIASVPIIVTANGVRRANGPLLVEPEDLVNAPISGTKRAMRMTVDGTDLSLRATRIFSLGAPRGIASTARHRKLISSIGERESTADPLEAPVALGMVDAAFVALAQPDSSGSANGTLVVIVPQSVDLKGVRERAARATGGIDWRPILAGLNATGSPNMPGASSPSNETVSNATTQPNAAVNDGYVPDVPPQSDPPDLPPLPDFLRD